MKILKRAGLIFLWLLIPALIATACLYGGVMLGGIPTMILYGPFFYLIFVTGKGKFDKKLPSENTEVDEALPLDRTQAPKQGVTEGAGGYSAIYQEKSTEREPGPLKFQTEGSERAPEAVTVLEKEPVDGVELLMKLQAEEEAKRASLEPPAPTERKKGAPVWSVVVLGALCVALAVTAGVTGWQWQGAAAERDTLLAQVTELEQNEKKLTDELRQVTLDRNANGAQRDVAEAKIERMKPELRFWLDAGCIAIEDNPYYHDNRCPDIEGADFWIYNVEAAKGFGYLPCPVCDPDSVLALYNIIEGKK